MHAHTFLNSSYVVVCNSIFEIDMKYCYHCSRVESGLDDLDYSGDFGHFFPGHMNLQVKQKYWVCNNL